MKKHPLEGILKDLSKIDFKKFKEDLEKKQENCPHENTIRLGPSFTTRYDGSFNKFDYTFCHDCGYSKRNY